SSDDVRSIETGILIVRIVVPDRESKGPGDPSREVGPLTSFQGQVLLARLFIRCSVVLLDEAPRAAHQVESHQFPPVVRVFTLLECGDRAKPALVAPDELHFSELLQEYLRPARQFF